MECIDCGKEQDLKINGWKIGYKYKEQLLKV